MMTDSRWQVGSLPEEIGGHLFAVVEHESEKFFMEPPGPEKLWETIDQVDEMHQKP